jgi:TonB family protein
MRQVSVAVLLILGSSACFAQTTQAEISSRLLSKPLQLRGFWTDDDLKFDAAGTPQKAYKTGSFTESGMNVRKVQVSGNRLEIEGDRVALEVDQDEIDEDGGQIFNRVRLPKGSGKTETIKIEVDCGQGADFTKALDAIFATSLAELAPSVPSYWQNFFQKNVLHDAAAAALRSSGVAHYKRDPTMQPPQVIKHADPRYTEIARRLGYSGDLLIDLVVTEQGLPDAIHIQRPAGLGLDEQAVKAVSQYRFKPAMKNGQPVKVELSINVRFDIRMSE